MSTRLGHIDLVSRLSQGSHLFIPPLTFDRASVLSATHLASLIRSSGREAQVLAHPSWIQHLMMEADSELFLLPDEYAYHLKDRPETTWLWGLSSPRQHSQELRNFMLGLNTVQVLDWTGERRRPIGDAVHQSPFLGGLTELSYSLSRELWPVHNWDDHYLGEGLASFMERYPLLTRDAPLVHLFGQLTLPHRPEEPLPQLSELLRQDDWALYCFRGLNPNQAALVERVLFDLFVSDPANHLIVMIEREEGKFTLLSIHSEVEDDLRARSWVRSKIDRAANGSDFIIHDPQKFLDALRSAIEVDVLEEEITPPETEISEEDDQDEAGEEVLVSHEEPVGEEVAEEKEESGSESSKDVRRKTQKLRLDPWPYPLYLGNHFSFGCADPQWAVERDQRLEEMRDLEEEEVTEEEEEEERRLLEWDSMQLLRRIQALKRPPIRLRWEDLKAAHLPVVKLEEGDLKSTFDSDLEEWERARGLRMKALLEAQAREAIRKAEEEALRELAEKTRLEEEEKARVEEQRRKEEEELLRLEQEEKRKLEEKEKAESVTDPEETQGEGESEKTESEFSEDGKEAEKEDRSEVSAESPEKSDDEISSDEARESDAIPDILHQQGEGWGAQEEEEDEESLLQAFDRLEEEHPKEEDTWEEEKGLDDSEGIEHPSLDMFMEEEEDPEELLAQLEEQEQTRESEESPLSEEDLGAEEEEDPEREDSSEEVTVEEDTNPLNSDESEKGDDLEDGPSEVETEDGSAHEAAHIETEGTQASEENAEGTVETEEILKKLESIDQQVEGGEGQGADQKDEIEEDVAQEIESQETVSHDEGNVSGVAEPEEDASSQKEHELNGLEDATEEAPEVSELSVDDRAVEEPSTDSEQKDDPEGIFSEPALSSDEILDQLEENFEIQEDTLEDKVEEESLGDEDPASVDEESASSLETDAFDSETESEAEDAASIEEVTSDQTTEFERPVPEEIVEEESETSKGLDLEGSSSEEETVSAAAEADECPQVPSESTEDRAEEEGEKLGAVEEEGEEKPSAPSTSATPKVTLGRKGPTGYLNPYLWDHRNELQDVFDEVRQSSVLRKGDWPYLVLLIVVGLFAWVHDLPML